MGAVIASDRVAEPFLEGTNSFVHGFTFGGHPMRVGGRDGQHRRVRATRASSSTCASNEGAFRAMLEWLRDIPIVGDVRGAGYFHAIELVKDPETKETFDDEESESLLRGFLSGELFRRGLICRADDRGDPVIQLSPPLIAGPEHSRRSRRVLRPVLEEASRAAALGG